MIDKKTIEHIAKLARLHVTDQEAIEFSAQLSKAIGYFEQIAKVPTTGVEPLVTPTEITEFRRVDQVERPLTAEEILSNAPDRVGNLFKVPPVV